MKLTFFGHAAFLVETSTTRIILDPYRSPDSGGYAPINVPADLVVVSHENDKYHSHLGQIVPPFDVLRAHEFPPEGVHSHGIHFQSIPVFETPEKLPGDEVTILHFRADGLHLVFLGDLGHPLSDSELVPLLHADLVLASTGGKPTIALDDLRTLLHQLSPRVVLPMHYWTPRINLPILPLDSFLSSMPDWPTLHVGSPTAEFGPTTLPSTPTIVCLDPCR